MPDRPRPGGRGGARRPPSRWRTGPTRLRAGPGGERTRGQDAQCRSRRHGGGRAGEPVHRAPAARAWASSVIRVSRSLPSSPLRLASAIWRHKKGKIRKVQKDKKRERYRIGLAPKTENLRAKAYEIHVPALPQSMTIAEDLSDFGLARYWGGLLGETPGADKRTWSQVCAAKHREQARSYRRSELARGPLAGSVPLRVPG